MGGSRWCFKSVTGLFYLVRSRSSYATKELCGQARHQKPRPSRVRSKASFGPCTDAVTQRVVVATV
jgi:hypothetical protein